MFTIDVYSDMYRWEIVELARKLLLNGFAVLCAQGSILQLVLALLVVIIHYSVIMQLQPMLLASNNAFHAYSTFLLLIVFLSTILLQVEAEFSPTGATRVGYNSALVLILLFGATIAVLVLGIGFLAKDIRRSFKKSSVMCNEKGRPIQLRKLDADAFHVFLR